MEGTFSVNLLSWAMDKALASHSVSRINIANANVTGYSPLEISFEHQLQLLKSGASHDNINVKFQEVKQSINQMMQDNTTRLIGESVQIDSEVIQMVKQSGHYQLLADIMSRKMGLMKLVISSRG